MFQSFTGSSRRPRQVNLSGRNPNPFANPGGSGGVNFALANAQQDRAQRQKEREKLQAAKTLQRIWRGHTSRSDTKSSLRAKWDNHEQTNAAIRAGKTTKPYVSNEESLMQLRLLAHFFDPRDAADVQRLLLHLLRSHVLNQNASLISDPWPRLYLKLENRCLDGLNFRTNHPSKTEQTSPELDALLEALETIAKLIPLQTALNAEKYYRVLARFTQVFQLEKRMKLFLRVLVQPLRTIRSETLNAYEGLAHRYLTMLRLHDLLQYENGMEDFADQVNIRLLARATVDVLSNQQRPEKAENGPFLLDRKERLALLANFIFFYRKAHNFTHPEAYSSDDDFIAVVTNLLSSLADEIDVEHQILLENAWDEQPFHFDDFIQAQLLSLVNQESIVGMLRSTQKQLKQAHPSSQNPMAASVPNKVTQNLASYTLTLLRLFHRRGDEIRMWFYLGSSDTLAETYESPIKFFWEAVQRTDCFQTIMQDSGAALNLVKGRERRSKSPWQPPRILEEQASNLDNEWRLVLVFMELYTFMLKVMDDEEFFSGSHVGSSRYPLGASKTQEKALPLAAIEELSTFLKNLGFTLYFHGAKLEDSSQSETLTDGISSYFGQSAVESHSLRGLKVAVKKIPHLAGITGMSIDYVKGLTTGLLRMIYERDSRRKFLPDGHWLMTSPFDMEAFIPAVVEEEESRNKLEGEDDYNDNLEDDGEEEYDQPSLVGTGRARQIRYSERLRQEQRKLSRKRYLQAVAPRLEILQNMPFLIPFTTRVEIFREFVHLDQVFLGQNIAYVGSSLKQCFTDQTQKWIYRSRLLADGNAQQST